MQQKPDNDTIITPPVPCINNTSSMALKMTSYFTRDSAVVF